MSIRKSGISVIYLKMGFKPYLSDADPPDSPDWISNTEPEMKGSNYGFTE